MAILVLTASCGGQGNDTAGTSVNGSGRASDAVLQAEHGPLGRILVDRRGWTVYVFAKDAAGTSSCTGACASNWPPVVAPDPLPSSVPGVSGALGTASRDDGSTQLTVADRPVYLFSGDTGAGQTNGQGLTLDGGLWTAVSPDGAPLAEPKPDASPSPPDSSPGGYGY